MREGERQEGRENERDECSGREKGTERREVMVVQGCFGLRTAETCWVFFCLWLRNYALPKR